MIAGRLSQSRSLGFLVLCGRTRHERLSLARAPRSYDRASRSLSRSKARLVSKSRLRVRLRCVKTGRSANTRGVFHLPRNSGNSGWDVNGTHVFGSFHWKISGINGTSEKVVLFSRWKLSDGNVYSIYNF